MEQNTSINAEENAQKEMDDIDLAKRVMAEHDEQESLDAQIESNNLQNVSLAEADLHMFGDRIILAEVTQLLAYIRHSVKNNMSTSISVKIGGGKDTVANAEFMFDLNGCQVPDCVTQSEWQIN